jgi:hypothetical protein
MKGTLTHFPDSQNNVALQRERGGLCVGTGMRLWGCAPEASNL